MNTGAKKLVELTRIAIEAYGIQGLESRMLAHRPLYVLERRISFERRSSNSDLPRPRGAVASPHALSTATFPNDNLFNAYRDIDQNLVS